MASRREDECPAEFTCSLMSSAVSSLTAALWTREVPLHFNQNLLRLLNIISSSWLFVQSLSSALCPLCCCQAAGDVFKETLHIYICLRTLRTQRGTSEGPESRATRGHAGRAAPRSHTVTGSTARTEEQAGGSLWRPPPWGQTQSIILDIRLRERTLNTVLKLHSFLPLWDQQDKVLRIVLTDKKLLARL